MAIESEAAFLALVQQQIASHPDNPVATLDDSVVNANSFQHIVNALSRNIMPKGFVLVLSDASTLALNIILTEKLYDESSHARADMFDRLIQNGVDINVKDSDGETALIRAAVDGDATAVIFLLAKGADINAVDTIGQTALMRSAREGKKAVIKELIHCGAGVDIADNEGWTALMLAAYNQRYKIVDFLIRHKANIYAANQGGQTTLMQAAENGDAKTANILIEHVKENDTPINSGLHWAKTSWSNRLGSRSIAGLARLIDAADNNGMTPLMLAALNGHGAVVNILLKNKASIDRVNTQGKTAFDLTEDPGIRDRLSKAKNENELQYCEDVAAINRRPDPNAKSK